jgi:CO/xanthine dehydrogenase FAD-binding subunit
MIVEYLRPNTIEEALGLINRREPRTYAMGGGTVLNRPNNEERYAVVDLQALGLNQMERSGNTLRVGAATTLQALVKNTELQPALREAIQRETNYHLRQAASLAGTIVSADGRSRLAGCLLAMDATLEVESITAGQEQLRIGELLAVQDETLRGKLITAVSLPLHVRLAFECISRTEGDEPIVYAAIAQWPSGRTRLALGGMGKAPLMAMDGPEAGGIETAGRNAYSQAGDAWATAEYRQEIAGLLAVRCLGQLDENSQGLQVK